jgi:hypothetical protein
MPPGLRASAVPVDVVPVELVPVVPVLPEDVVPLDEVPVDVVPVELVPARPPRIQSRSRPLTHGHLPTSKTTRTTR